MNRLMAIVGLILLGITMAQTPKGCIGVVLQDFSYTQSGALITEVRTGPARTAGLEAGLVIIKLGVWPITSYAEFVRALRGYQVGEATYLTVGRYVDGTFQNRPISIVIGQRLSDGSCRSVPARY